MPLDFLGKREPFWLDILELLLIHSEVVTQFMYEGLSNLMTNFGLGGADCFDILLIKHDVIRPHRQFKYSFLCRGHTMENA